MKRILPIVFFITPLLAAAYTPQKQSPEAQAQSLQLVSRSAGRVGNEYLTTRGVQISSWIEDVLYRSAKPRHLDIKNVENRDFLQETTAVLLETAIALEAQDFPASQVADDELERQFKKSKRLLEKETGWKTLSVTDGELREFLSKKLRSKKFIQFKIDLASLPVSDQEVKEYFEKNRFKFENLPFENFKNNIRAFLTRRQVDERMKEWFEVLQIKYRLRNHLSEEKI